MVSKKENGPPGSMTDDQQKVIIPMGRKMKPGPAGGTMIAPGKKCRENTGKGKWWINGTFTIRTAT